MRGLDFGGGSKIARFNNFAKKLDPPFFLNCVIPDQYYERNLRPEGVFRDGTDIQTDMATL